MAKAVTRRPGTPGTSAGERVGYLRGVWDELRKVIWPTGTELWRMTGIVVATVIIFAALIGGADYALSWVVRPIYTVSNNVKNATQNTTQNTTPTQALPSTQPSAAPQTAAPVTP